MRIAVLSRNFVATGGGAERYAIAIVEQLAARNEVHVYAQNIDHAFPGVTYHRLPARLQRPRWVNQLLFAWCSWRATRHGFDIVHSHENVWHGNVQTVHVLPVKYSLLAGRQGIRRTLQWLRICTSPRLLTYMWLEYKRFACVPGRRIVVTSSGLGEAMQQAYPQTTQQFQLSDASHAISAMAVITPGVDVVEGTDDRKPAQRSARSRLGLPSEGTCLLFVGNDFRKKGLPALIGALAQLTKTAPDIFLAVVGNPAQRGAMQVFAEELGVGQRVYFLGSLAKMEWAYSAADCLVHPTLQDAYAMVVLEAMAHAVPVVVSAARYCGIAADLQDGQEAMLLEHPRDAGQIARAVDTVLTQPAVQARLVSGGLAFAQRHSWEESGMAHQKLFEEVLACR